MFSRELNNANTVKRMADFLGHHLRIMKKIILILAAMLTLASCTKEGDVIYQTVLSEYFADGPLFCFRWQKPGKELRRENWEIISCENGKMVNKAFLRHADGTTYTITAHLTKVLEKV